MRKLTYTLIATIITAFGAFAQTGELSGRVIDDKSNGVPFANVVLEQNGAFTGLGTTTDFDGFYTIKPIDPGKYDVKFSYLGYKTTIINDVQISSDKIRTLNTTLAPEAELIREVVIQEWKDPLIDPENTPTKNTISKEVIEKAPTKNINTLAATSAAVYQSDDGAGLNLKGARTDATEYYIDGIKVRGASAIPTVGIEEMTVITGGLPAKFGDATGGVITITTRGPSKTFAGGLEIETSQFLDPFGYNLGSATLTGPVLMMNKGTDMARPLIGFFIAAEIEDQDDPDPSAVGVYQVKPEILDSIRNNPIVENPTGEGIVLASEQVTMDDLVHMDVKPNSHRTGVRFTGKLDFKVSSNVNLTFGGQMDYGWGHDWIDRYTMFNYENNNYSDGLTWRVFGRFTQKFANKTNDEESKTERPVFSNAFYSVQVDYSRNKSKQYDDSHKFDPFVYGHVGSFETFRTPFYFYGEDSLSGLDGWRLLGYVEDSIVFTPGPYNVATSNYTSNVYSLLDELPSSFSEIQLNRGVLNGDRPASVYGIWWGTGREFNGYGITADNDQYRLVVNGSVDISSKKSADRNKHAIEFGFEFEQRVDRGWNIGPLGLWTLMRQLANRHIDQLDLSNPILIIDGVEYAWNEAHPAFGENDSIFYNRKYVETDQTYFDQQLREALGLEINSLDYIDIDALDPSTFSLDMFSADELLNSGSGFVNYFGYDYLGNKLSTQPTFDDFFTQKDANDNYTRAIGAFRPIYTAGYIQDKFAYKDLLFNIGVRVDRFDANQKVMKDKYSLYSIRSVAEVEGTLNPSGDHPSTMGDDYAVYVDDFNSATPTIVGYRNGDTWYNAEGSEVFDPKVIAQATSSGQITPYLTNIADDIKSEDFDPGSSFKDYEPQVSVMPRIAFSFNLSDNALFFAHYDVLTQRPQGSIFTTPLSYYFFQEFSTGLFNNPDLKPEKTIDYQLGFQQVIGKKSSITFTLFYRELRDMVQSTRVDYAYPNNYTTFGNEDFGTVKGLSLSYDLRRRPDIDHVQLKANYTLQFAEGTGSNSTSQLNLLSLGADNLKTIVPLSYDVRHTINLQLDYRFGYASNYVGPTLFGKDILENAGASVIFRARSGEPYTQQSNPTATGLFTQVNRTTLEGEINGSRLPANYKMDIRIDKDFSIKTGKSADGTSKRIFDVNVYLMVQNVLNTKNVVFVYPYSNSAEDDGYLTSGIGQADLATQPFPQSYEDLYYRWVNYPNNYSLPRRIRLGLQVNF